MTAGSRRQAGLERLTHSCPASVESNTRKVLGMPPRQGEQTVAKMLLPMLPFNFLGNESNDNTWSCPPIYRSLSIYRPCHRNFSNPIDCYLYILSFLRDCSSSPGQTRSRRRCWCSPRLHNPKVPTYFCGQRPTGSKTTHCFQYDAALRPTNRTPAPSRKAPEENTSSTRCLPAEAGTEELVRRHSTDVRVAFMGRERHPSLSRLATNRPGRHATSPEAAPGQYDDVSAGS